MSFSTSILRKAKTFQALPWRDRAGIVRAWVMLLAVDAALRVAPFPNVQAYAARAAEEQQRSEIAAWTIIHRRHRWVQIAARYHLYPMRCLRQALVLQRLLGQLGIPTSLRFGVNTAGTTLDAHAWLTYREEPIGQPGNLNERFTPLISSKVHV